MKAKSYGLTDFSQLKKSLEAELKQREQTALEQEQQRVSGEQLASEFKSAVKQVIPLKGTQTYIHPPRPIKLPEVKQNQRTSLPKNTAKDELSDAFDARHLRDDEAGVFVRQGVAPAQLKKLQTNFWPIDVRLDLHGKSIEEARIATSAFLYQVVALKARVALVVHGQGHGAPSGESVLKFNVKNWLVQNRDVLAFCAAPSNEGGQGATLVLLRVVNEHD